MRASVRWLIAGAAIVVIAACSDSTTSPRSAAASSPVPNAPVFDYSATSYTQGSSAFDFDVGPSGGSFSIGGLYAINFPPNSICDPAVSTYGPGEWDKDCTTLSGGQTVRLHASLALSPNGLAIDFSPALRFSPATRVSISTDIFAPVLTANRDFFSKNPSALNSLAILYSPNLGALGLSDYINDPSVVTQVDLTTGRISRRVKHFSGYSIVSGEACEPAPDNPNCVQVH